MNIADPKYLEQLRDQPTWHLFDLLTEDDDVDQESIYRVLQERGLDRQDILDEQHKRQHSRSPKAYTLWTIARWLTLFNALIVGYFNASGLYQLFRSDHPFRQPLLFLTVGCVMAGFFVGYKLTICLYQGEKAVIYCGFPIPVGQVDLTSGEERNPDKKIMLIRMAINAMVGVSLTLFPLVFLFTMMD